jgi:hypothetical protein
MAQQGREQKEVIRLLKEHGATLERTKKHHIWRLPDGRIHVLPSSPSCAYAWKNQLSDLRKFLGVVPSDRGKPGERRAKKTKTKRVTSDFSRETAAILLAPSIRGLDALSELRVDLPPMSGSSSTPSSPTSTSVWWNPWTWKIFTIFKKSAERVVRDGRTGEDV